MNFWNQNLQRQSVHRTPSEKTASMVGHQSRQYTTTAGKLAPALGGEVGGYKSDRSLLKILLRNLIENAVKFRDDQKQNSCIHIFASKLVNGRTKISIRDNGIGIPPAYRDKVFDMFVIASVKSKGFGLGLYEAKLIVRKLEGTIELAIPEKGDTEFIITL